MECCNHRSKHQKSKHADHISRTQDPHRLAEASVLALELTSTTRAEAFDGSILFTSGMLSSICSKRIQEWREMSMRRMRPGQQAGRVGMQVEGRCIARLRFG